MSSSAAKPSSDELPALRIQRRLLALGYDLGRGGPDRDGVDGDLGELSQTAILAALETSERAPERTTTSGETARANLLPVEWLPPAKMARIIVHWTAGQHDPSDQDRAHYHVLIDGAGSAIRGIPSIALNDARGVKSGYAAHTLNCNTGSIGVSLCCMAGAVENPFRPGMAPMTVAQWDALPRVLAELCRRYGIAVSPRTVLSHAEVEGTLGIKQRGKWDIARLPFAPDVRGASAIGDIFRSRTSPLLAIS